MDGDHFDSKYHSPWAVSARPAAEARVNKTHFPKPKRWMVALAVLAFAAIAGFGVYTVIARIFFAGQISNISLEFSKPSQVLVGEPFSVSVSISNYSDNVLKNAKLSLFLPEGIFFVGRPNGQRISEQVVGDLGPGSINQQSFNLLALEKTDVLRRLEARLTYSFSQTSSAEFQSSASLDLLINQPAVALDVGAPQSVFGAQDFDVKIAYVNNANHDFKDVHLKISYPPVFKFGRASVAPEGAGNNSWDLGTVPAGGRGSITVSGTIIGSGGSSYAFGVSVDSAIAGNVYSVASGEASVAISQSPLSLSIGVNNSSTDYVSRLGDTLLYTIEYKNNSNVVMQNVKIQAKLVSQLFDFPKLQTTGYFDSLSNTILWSPANESQLASVLPQQGGSVTFTIPTKDAFPIRLLSDKNYTLKLQAHIESPTVPQDITAEKTVSIAAIENKVAGKIDLSSAAYWRDAASGILNAGPYPPRVNQPTQYTVHWKIVNYATDATGVKVSAYLQSGARFTGKVKSVADTAPVYNPNSGLVSWDIPFIPATKGVISAPAEAIFQVEVTPSVIQVGSRVTFVGEATLEWTDSFINRSLVASAPSVDTSLPSDTSATALDRTVKP